MSYRRWLLAFCSRSVLEQIRSASSRPVLERVGLGITTIDIPPEGTLRDMKKDGNGFTIVELLIVIAVLAAISIAAYTNFQSRAHASVVQSDLTNAMKKLKLHRVTEAYPTTTDQLRALDITVGKNSYEANTIQANFYYCLNKETDELAIGARTPGNKDLFIITSSEAVKRMTIIDGNRTCQAIGLTGISDSSAYYTYGYLNSTGGWQSWVK